MRNVYTFTLCMLLQTCMHTHTHNLDLDLCIACLYYVDVVCICASIGKPSSWRERERHMFQNMIVSWVHLLPFLTDNLFLKILNVFCSIVQVAIFVLCSFCFLWSSRAGCCRRVFVRLGVTRRRFQSADSWVIGTVSLASPRCRSAD